VKLALIAILALIHATPSKAAIQSDASGIMATGTCLKKISQDRAAVTLSVSTLAPNPSLASNETTKLHQKLRDAVQHLKLENLALETTNYSVGEEREWVNKKMVSKGFRSRISLVVETSEISRVGEVIAAATKLGVKDIDGLNTFVSSDKYKAEYEGCLEVATRNARDKALKLAKGAGVKLGKVKSISEGPAPSSQNYGNRPVMMTRAFSDAAAPELDAGPTIDTKSVDLNVSATVTFDAD